MAHKLVSGQTATGIGRSIKIGETATDHAVMVRFKHTGATPITALVVKLQGSLIDDNAATGITSNPALAIGSTKPRVANGAFDYRINNVNYSKGAVAAGTAASAAHVITALGFGVIRYNIKAAGTITTQVPAATQNYASAALAIAAAEAIETTSGLCYIGSILVESPAGGFAANTTDLDLTTYTTYIDADFRRSASPR